MSSYSDEDLYMHYRRGAASAEDAERLVTEHRARYPAAPVRDTTDWDGLARADIERAVMDAIKRAAKLPAGAERTALLAHAMTGVDALAEVAPKKGKR